MDEMVLEISNLKVDFKHDGNYHTAVNGVSYHVRRGHTLGIVGESGSGKSVSSLSIMGLLPQPPQCRIEGSIHFWPANTTNHVEILDLKEAELRQYRGKHISMIFQEPMTSLNPVHRCGDQVMEILQMHEKISTKEAKRRVLSLFEEVMLPRPEKIFNSYPHEISGGQKQRVMIAMALICHPDLLIADEPTTALDVTVQKTILELLRNLQKKYNIGIIFISHDLGVIAQIADEIAVMYHGQIVEQGSANSILHNPQHPYTQGLLACRPPLDSRPSHLPTVKEFLEGNVNHIEPQLRNKVEMFHEVPLLQVHNLGVNYPLKRNIFGKVTKELKAVDGLSFNIYRGETLGLVGESGCGKSTLGRAILQLIEKNDGAITYDGIDLDKMSRSQQLIMRRKMQIVFQDPYSSLNPRYTIGEAILEPLQCHKIGANNTERRSKVLELMRQVGLDPSWYDRYPHEFSGGQRQRVCIARALILEPELVVCDESVSALDVSVQAQVLNLLNDLKSQYGYTYLFITHDLSVVKFFSDRIMVMQQGHIVEQGPADEIFNHPQHPYTQRLLEAIPKIN
ncbi:MAG: ABC transporter ATP-binding protein [Bacteroidales bacterium]|nr:ABC transporter ATP-binding protein [Bacteroidales bacterium]